MANAVSSCIDAAAAEFDPASQKRYLRAASYGMGAAVPTPELGGLGGGGGAAGGEGMGGDGLDDEHGDGGAGLTALSRAATPAGSGSGPAIDPQPFVDTCKRLRVLNTVRHRSVGMPLTSEQLKRLTPTVLVDRLVSRRKHHLAIKVERSPSQ